jgi:hypothetical protein
MFQPFDLDERSVREADIDLLMIDLIVSSDAFRCWFSETAGYSATTATTFNCARNFVDAYGEADILLVQHDRMGRHALLIENKIDAVIQPRQAERYQDRGMAGVENGLWSSYSTVLVAPEVYCMRNGTLFDASIAYEAVKGWLEAQDEPLFRYKQHQLADALGRTKLAKVSLNRNAYADYVALFANDAARNAVGLIDALASKPSVIVNWRPKSFAVQDTTSRTDIFYCDYVGSASFNFKALAASQAFAPEADRQALMGRLNAIDGVVVKGTNRKFQGFPLRDVPPQHIAAVAREIAMIAAMLAR